MNRNLIKCNSVNYRKGYIEVRGDIHPNCINVEVWNIHPDIDISDMDLNDDLMSDEAVTGNTEIELSVKNAEYLLQKLTIAIELAKERGNM